MTTKKLYVSNSEESIRLFDHPVMEALSKVHYSVPPLIFVPVIAYFVYLGIVETALGWIDFIAWLALGLLAWTMTEYIMHRFVVHFHPTSEWGKKLHFIFQGIHHDYPCDRLRLVLPPSVSIPLATAFYFLWRAILPSDGLYPFFAAFILGYLVYDMFHYAIHHVPVKGGLWNQLKTHHLKHHYVDPNKGFGVSSPLWDYLVHTNFADKKVSKDDFPITN